MYPNSGIFLLTQLPLPYPLLTIFPQTIYTENFTINLSFQAEGMITENTFALYLYHFLKSQESLWFSEETLWPFDKFQDIFHSCYWNFLSLVLIWVQITGLGNFSKTGAH